MHDGIDTGSYLPLNRMLLLVGQPTKREICEAPQSTTGAICMNCREHSTMPGIQGVEKSARFGTAHLTNDDPVRTMAEDSFQQVVEGDRALVGIELGLGGDDVRLSDNKFCRVFNDQNAIFVGDRIGEDVYQGGLASAGASRYQDIVATMDGLLEFRCQFWRDELLGDQVLHLELPGGEFANCEQGTGVHHWWNDGGQPAAISQPQVHDRAVRIELFPEAVGDH